MAGLQQLLNLAALAQRLSFGHLNSKIRGGAKDSTLTSILSLSTHTAPIQFMTETLSYSYNPIYFDTNFEPFNPLYKGTDGVVIFGAAETAEFFISFLFLLHPSD
jgi:hypothetical protein